METKKRGYNSNQRCQIETKKKKICEHLEEIQSFPDPFKGSGRASERASERGRRDGAVLSDTYLVPGTLPFEVSSPISRSWLGFSR